MRPLLLLILLPLSLMGAPNDKGDFQVWTHLRYEVFAPKTIWNCLATPRLPKGDLGIRLIAEERFGDDASKFYFQYFQGQVAYVTKRTEIAPGYRQQFEITPRGWAAQYMPLLDYDIKRKLGCWHVDIRNRFFYSMPDGGLNHWIYRNRLRFVSPLLKPCPPLKFFVFEEVFFRQRDGFYQNRVSAGLTTDINKNFDSTLSYILRNAKAIHWTHHHILFMQVTFKF